MVLCRSTFLRVLLLLPLIAAGPLCAAPATARLQVENAWARPTPPGVDVAAVYLRLRNQGEADRLLSLSSPLATKVELHESRMSGAMMSMRRLPFVDLPTGGVLRAEPGGLHIMMLGLRRALAVGEELSLTLVFAHAGEITTAVKVRSDP